MKFKLTTLAEFRQVRAAQMLFYLNDAMAVFAITILRTATNQQGPLSFITLGMDLAFPGMVIAARLTYWV